MTNSTLSRGAANDCPQDDNNKQRAATQLTNFYEGKNILITGSSGFLGKVLLWKLIESCTNCGTIYVLLRSKNNVSAEKRLVQMLKTKPFAPKYDLSYLLKRIVAIDSELTAEGLSLSRTDRTLLQDKVNIVFHSAASVKFDAPLKDNMRDNLTGTINIIDLCKGIKRLDALVHVSTAYSNAQLKEIGEELVPIKESVDDVVQMVNSMSSDACKKLADTLMEGRPNTYTYTKALAEHFVARNQGQFPIAIVRPSIIISSATEPLPGWVDNVNGIAGLGSLGAIGLLRTIDWNYHAVSDMVPVDYVANCLICAAYQVGEQSRDTMKIYNMTSGNMNPISWGRFFDMLRSEAVTTPPVKIVRPMIKPPRHTRINPIEFFLTKYFSEILFAYFVDMILMLIGYKKIMVKITHKMHHGYVILRPFTMNQWIFHSDNVTSLSDSLEQQDRDTFKFDMRNFDWQQQARVTWSGARESILKEEPTEESYRLAKSRQTLVTWVHYAGIALLTTSFAMISYSGLNLIRAF